MAEPEQKQDEKKKKAKKEKPIEPAGLRFFYEPTVRLVRLGREVGRYRGDFGRFHVGEGQLEFLNGIMVIDEARLSASRVRLNIGANRLFASGKVRVEEKGVIVESDMLMATPSLTGMRLEGNVRVRSRNRSAFRDMMDNRKA